MKASASVQAKKTAAQTEKLNEEHLAIFRDKHAELIRSLGYEVR